MATMTTVWIDDAGIFHKTEADAKRSDFRIKAEKALQLSGVQRISLQPLETVNHQTLEPLKTYIDTLVAESIERTNKYG